MDVLLRTRGTIEGGVRGVFDVIREITCKLEKFLPERFITCMVRYFFARILSRCHNNI